VRVAWLLGLLVAVPVLGLVALLRPGPAPPRSWSTARQPPIAATAPEAGWNRADRESLGKLREVTIEQTRRVVGDLELCETQATRLDDTARNRAYRRCATPALAWADGIGTANGRMLSNLAASTAPPGACRERMLRLSGTTANLAFSASTTLRGGLDAPWVELLAASRTIRAFATEASQLARASGWGRTCKAKPPAREPAVPVA